MQLKKYRASLRYQRELSEGVTYESNSALLKEPAVQINKECMSDDEGTMKKIFP